MRYDVFLVSCLADRDAARLVVRRLRSLKFRVAFNPNQVDEVFGPKEARDLTSSECVLVLWSEAAFESDWVRAAASVGHARPDTLIQAALDGTRPYEPFGDSQRFNLEGMTSRRTPEGFILLVEEIAGRTGRSGLREWMALTSRDDDQRSAWLAAHESDPLAEDARRKRERDLGLKPAPAREAIGAAALAAASLKAGGGRLTAASARPVPAQTNEQEISSFAALLAVSLSILAMLALAWLFRSESARLEGSASAGATNAIAHSVFCPAGSVPRSLVSVLEHGQIIDDTSAVAGGTEDE